MHSKVERAAAVNSSAECNSTRDSVSLHRDPATDEWVFDLSPGLDLLEIARVLSVVQQHALQLLQQQLHEGAAIQSTTNGTPVLPTNGIPDAMSNQFAQL